MATGIRDKVAIIGMGCSKFGERWADGPEDLIAEAFGECIQDAGIDKTQIQAAWMGCCFDEVGVGKSAIPASFALRLPNIAVSRMENYCASGTEAFRGAVYAVASGAYDITLAIGVEKLKDIGYGGLPEFSSAMGMTYQQWLANMTAPGGFAMLATGYASKYGIDMGDIKRAMAHVSVKSHANGALNPKAHLRKPVTEEQVLNSPHVAYPLGLFDCCGVSDGSACAIVTTPEIAKSLGKKDLVTVKALQLSLSNGTEFAYDWDGAHFITTTKASKEAYKEAGIKNPREEISMMEVHDCFSVTELVTMEDLHIS
ncbi:MAG TPA: acetyl-CoA acetyltransferase, partial [Deltaproteobacteria bacterium]|nr:acetyl-CoA acetyltransferase [Deltaproteobacteria bacterium]